MDIVKPLKIETDVDDDLGIPTEADPTEDALIAFGYAVGVSGTIIQSVSGNIMGFKDGEITSITTLSDLAKKLNYRNVSDAAPNNNDLLTWNQTANQWEPQARSPQIKSGIVSGSSFTGNPKKTTITFSTSFPSNNYSVTVTGEVNRTFTIESKTASSFVINANANASFTVNVFWQAIFNGEF